MKFIVLFLMLLQPVLSFSQVSEMGQLNYGKVGISIYYQDTLINVGSNKLVVVIDEDTREIIIKLDPSSLKTGIDSLDSKLQSGFPQEVVFNGVIGLNKIWSKESRSTPFEVEGELTINNVTKKVSLFGSLRESQQGMGVNSVLYLHFDPELKEFELDKTLVGFANLGCVEILQPVRKARP